jgi:hypothetical protein
MQLDDVEELDGGANRNRGKDGDRLRRLAEAGSKRLRNHNLFRTVCTDLMIVWLFVLFVSFGLFAPRNARFSTLNR